MDKNKLNLGCGSVRPESWINTDSSLNSLLQNLPFGKVLSAGLSNTVYDGKAQYMNLNKRWGYADDSIDIVYGSHIFEHLSFRSSRLFLSESYRTLKRNGVIRLVVPDLLQHAKHYIESAETEQEKATQQFLMMLNLHREGQYKSSFIHNTIGWFQDYPHQHKYMYDKYSLIDLLSQFNFEGLIQSSYGVSEYILEISDVESNLHHEYDKSLYIEGVKHH